MLPKTKVYYADGTQSDAICKCVTEYCDAISGDIEAVYMNHRGQNALHSELGAEISIDLGSGGTYMADRLYCDFWCTPSFGTLGNYGSTDHIQYLVYRRYTGKFGVIVPVVSDDYKCVLHGDEDRLSARLFSWTEGMTDCACLAYVTAEGNDPFLLTKACVAYALRVLKRENALVDRKCYPEVFDYLGWCSWDAMPIAVNEAGVIAKCEEFKQKNIPVKWAILDDMWSEITEFNGDILNDLGAMFKIHHETHMYDYEAAYSRFPSGLSGIIEKIHQYGLMAGVWHPTSGYWSGLDENGAAYQKLKDYTYITKDGKIVGAWDEANAFGYYHTMHDFFRRCGADFLKVDYQSTTRRHYKGADSVGKVARSWHNGLEASVGLHFNNVMINCMGMASEDMWNRSFSSISRCSDDFKPEDSAWFAKHITQCTYNSVIQGQFYWNDYDMWWTDDSQGRKNSLLRAVSGGPIYVSDAIGRSRAEILKPLAFDDGRILRCERSGMPTADCLTVDPEQSGKPLKIQNIVKGCGIVAAFNIDRNKQIVTGSVSAADVPGLGDGKYVLYEHFSRKHIILEADEAYRFELESTDDYKLFLLIPYINNVAHIGRLDKFISPAAIDAVIGEHVKLYEDGEYGFVKNGELIVENRNNDHI